MNTAGGQVVPTGRRFGDPFIMTSNYTLGLFISLSLLGAACGGTAAPSDRTAVSNLAGGDACHSDGGASDGAACKGPTPMCAPGTVLVDADGDGCVDGCAPPSCQLAVLCNAGTTPVDTDGDGCDDACKPPACPPFVPTCSTGQKPADTNGDGCVDGCTCALAFLCQPNLKPVDKDGDGCDDACE